MLKQNRTHLFNFCFGFDEINLHGNVSFYLLANMPNDQYLYIFGCNKKLNSSIPIMSGKSYLTPMRLVRLDIIFRRCNGSTQNMKGGQQKNKQNNWNRKKDIKTRAEILCIMFKEFLFFKLGIFEL